MNNSRKLLDHLYRGKVHTENRLNELEAIRVFPSETDAANNRKDIDAQKSLLAFIDSAIDIILAP